ncbi:MAG: thiamine-phosphate kinase [Nitrosopumilaceae archaeon]|nr:thiamine-phosphate kinase [Nitrosopumilaceae archaeon]
MNKLDETEIIKKFQLAFGNKNFVTDDVESFSFGNSQFIVKVDTLVQSTDIPPKMSIKNAVRKSIVSCLSDFASKGARPKFGIVSVNVPTNFSTKQVREMTDGIRKASKEFGINFLGGDTNQGKELVFHVCLFGSAKKIVKRKGAKPGDLIFTSGPFGFTGAGLQILLKNIKTRNSFAKSAIKSVLKPNPRLEFGLKCNKYFSSSMDSSDGLSTTLNEMASQSKCRFVIDLIPAPSGVFEFAKKFKKNFESMVFHTGEEYEIVFTTSAKYKSKIIEIAKNTKTPIIQIGKVAKGKGVYIQKEKLEKLPDLGYHHFKISK